MATGVDENPGGESPDAAMDHEHGGEPGRASRRMRRRTISVEESLRCSLGFRRAVRTPQRVLGVVKSLEDESPGSRVAGCGDGPSVWRRTGGVSRRMRRRTISAEARLRCSLWFRGTVRTLQRGLGVEKSLEGESPGR